MEAPKSVMALLWRYRRERLSIPSKSATVTWDGWVRDFKGLEDARSVEQYLFNLVVVDSQVFQAAGEVCRDAGQVVVL